MPGHTRNRFLLLYGSQTGQAKAISEEICEKAEQEGLHAELHCLSHTEKKFNIEKEKCVVIVTSTTGDGEPPETASKFVRRLKKKTLPDNHLAGLNYALLGLGDSNYTNFCNCAKTLDRRLEELGAKRFYSSGFADDAVGLEVMVEPWMESLFPALRTFLHLPHPTGSESELANGDHGDSLRVQDDLIINNTVEGVGNLSLQGNGSSVKSESQPQNKNTVNGVSNISESEDISSTKEKTQNERTSQTESSNSVNDKLENTPQINSSNLVQIKDEKIAENNSTDSCDGARTNVTQLSATASTQLSVSDSASGADASESSPLCPSLLVSVPPLSDGGLNLPALPPPFLTCSFQPQEQIDLDSLPIQNGCRLPSAAGDVTMVEVSQTRILTQEDSVKKTLLLSLNTKGTNLKYQPGDAISVICQNEQGEVQELIERLHLSELCDTPVELSVLADTKKRNASVPPHLPPLATLRHILTTCVDVRDQPKKALLRILVEYTSNEREKRRLQELCSKQGGGDYSSYIREPQLSLLDILKSFPSCQPPVERVLEQLPRLQPRPYSVCSCPQSKEDKLDIAFNVVDISVGEGRLYSRRGVCTGWLDQLTSSNHGDEKKDQCKIMIPIFTRTNQHFRCPEDLSVPMILIGPGTGVAPFIGFLQQREFQMSQSEQGSTVGLTWLFYGCRHQDKDFLFRQELERFVDKKVLNRLLVSFSRDEQPADAPRYVQDNLRLQGETILDLIEKDGARVYVCGDAKGMARDVNNTFVQMLSEKKGLSEKDAAGYMMQMRLHKTYLEDVWT